MHAYLKSYTSQIAGIYFCFALWSLEKILWSWWCFLDCKVKQLQGSLYITVILNFRIYLLKKALHFQHTNISPHFGRYMISNRHALKCGTNSTPPDKTLFFGNKLFLTVCHKIFKFIYFEKAAKIWRNLQFVFEITE